MNKQGKYTTEFYAWAYSNGLPARGPRGSAINRVRARLLPKLYAVYDELRKSLEEFGVEEGDTA